MALLGDPRQLQTAIFFSWAAVVRRASGTGMRLATLVQRLTLDESLLLSEVCCDLSLSMQQGSPLTCQSDALLATHATLFQSSLQYIIASWASLHSRSTDSRSKVEEDINMIRRLRVVAIFSLPTRHRTAAADTGNTNSTLNPSLMEDSSWAMLQLLLDRRRRVSAPHCVHWPSMDASVVKILR